MQAQVQYLHWQRKSIRRFVWLRRVPITSLIVQKYRRYLYLWRGVGNVISTDISDTNIQDCAKHAVWLGNDEAHYVRKWEDRDIEDLIMFIPLTCNWIHSGALTQQYRSEKQT